MIHVADVLRSINFYKNLGFKVGNDFKPDDAAAPTWVWLHCDAAQLMVTKAGAPVVPEQQAVLFYLYCEDVKDARTVLVQHGIKAGPIEYPFYAPRGEFRLVDPDGYCLMVSHT